MGRGRKRRSHRVSDKISELDRTLLFCYLFAFFLSFSFSLSLSSIARTSLPSQRSHSFLHLARLPVHVFFSNPLLRYSAALNGRLLLPLSRIDANPLLRDVPLRFFFDSINLTKEGILNNRKLYWSFLKLCEELWCLINDQKIQILIDFKPWLLSEASNLFTLV